MNIEGDVQYEGFRNNIAMQGASRNEHLSFSSGMENQV